MRTSPKSRTRLLTYLAAAGASPVAAADIQVYDGPPIGIGGSGSVTLSLSDFQIELGVYRESNTSFNGGGGWTTCCTYINDKCAKYDQVYETTYRGSKWLQVNCDSGLEGVRFTELDLQFATDGVGMIVHADLEFDRTPDRGPAVHDVELANRHAVDIQLRVRTLVVSQEQSIAVFPDRGMARNGLIAFGGEQHRGAVAIERWIEGRAVHADLVEVGPGGRGRSGHSNRVVAPEVAV